MHCVSSRFLIALVGGLLSTGCCCPENPFQLTAVPNPPSEPGVAIPAQVATELPPTPTKAEFRNVGFHMDPDFVLHIRQLRGLMEGNNGGPGNLDDKTSFTMTLSHAVVELTAQDLTVLMNRYVFGYQGAPIRELVVHPEGGRLYQEGVLHKVIDIPFSMIATVEATPDGWVRIHPESMNICDLPGMGLMAALGIELDDLIDVSGRPGIRVEGNDILLHPLDVLPPPATRGQLTATWVEGDHLVQVFGSEADVAAAGAVPPMPLPDAPNYMFFWDGVLRFGKLHMPEADMQVVDTSPTDPFDFFLEYYNWQLVEGFTRNGSDYGLEVHMVDFAKLEEAHGATAGPDGAPSPGAAPVGTGRSDRRSENPPIEDVMRALASARR